MVVTPYILVYGIPILLAMPIGNIIGIGLGMILA
jgi:hypothetical protein